MPQSETQVMEPTTLAETSGIPSVEKILARFDAPVSAQGEELIRGAYEAARQAHEGQKRKSGEPYFTHPAQVAWMLAELVNDPATVAAGLLHDTIEDCGITVEALRKEFPEPVAELVDGVTKISSLHFASDRDNQAGSLRKMVLAMARDVRVLLIKLCDRLHNLLTLQHLPPTRQRAIAQSTLDIYAPLANRLGMTRIRVHLEDFAMPYIYPAAYARLSDKMAVRQKNDRHIVSRMREQLSEQLAASNIPATIYGRCKHLFSIHEKMRRQGLRFDEVRDILALRVITDTVTECYGILGVVHSLWKPLDGYFNDYIGAPKENGYRSLHTTVIGADGELTEIQIRTHEMHHLAEEGIAAHWKYKETGGSANNGKRGARADEQKLAWLRQLVDWLQDERDASEFMRELKRDVFEASVFCYTPKGDIIEMPRGSTALDLAYRIHTDLGHTCGGARINHRIASIRTLLQTGDVVEIIASKSSRPTDDWLQFAHTGRARNKIRHWLKERRREEYLERGRRALAETIKRRFSGQVSEEKAREIIEPQLKNYSVATWDDLLVEIGCGTLKIAGVVARIEQVLQPPIPRRIPREARRQSKKREKVLVEGISGAVTRMARCCSPLPGDSIVGFITQSRGITIHREDCGSLERVRARRPDGEQRFVQVDWSESGKELQKVTIRLVSQDRKGLVSDVSSAVTQLNLNIAAMQTSTNIRDNRAIFKLKLFVENSDELNLLLNRLSKVPGVLSLSRVMHSK